MENHGGMQEFDRNGKLDRVFFWLRSIYLSVFSKVFIGSCWRKHKRILLARNRLEVACLLCKCLPACVNIDGFLNGAKGAEEGEEEEVTTPASQIDMHTADLRSD